jgi:H+/Cl- antiporter ClcA
VSEGASNLETKRIESTKYGLFLYLAIIGLIVGAVVGAIDALFGEVLLAITDFRMTHALYLLPFLAFAGLGIVFAYQKFGGSAGKGMGLVFQIGHGDETEPMPKRLVPLIMVSTWLTHLFGGSAGREGVAVQMGATFSDWLGRMVPVPLKNRHTIFIVVGMAAGFGGLFQTPIAAVFFAIEVLAAGALRYEALLPAMVASFTASNISHALGLEKFAVHLVAPVSLAPMMLIRLAILGIIFGLAGGLFAFLLKRGKGMAAEYLPNPLIRVVSLGIVLSILFLVLYMGRYSGLGTNLIADSFSGKTIYKYDWLLKLVLTVLTLAAGFQGGEVTPLFAIGATLGTVVAPLVGVPPELAAALGYASVFGGATNTLLAPLFIGCEVFGFSYAPYFFIVCAFAYLCNTNRSIYAQKLGAKAYELEE